MLLIPFNLGVHHILCLHSIHEKYPASWNPKKFNHINGFSLWFFIVAEIAVLGNTTNLQRQGRVTVNPNLNSLEQKLWIWEYTHSHFSLQWMYIGFLVNHVYS